MDSNDLCGLNLIHAQTEFNISKSDFTFKYASFEGMWFKIC